MLSAVILKIEAEIIDQ